MTQENKYIDEYKLMVLLQTQQQVCEGYTQNNYFGQCMRIVESQTADFLQDFVNGNILVDQKNFDILESLLIVVKHSKYGPIKNIRKAAIKKYNEMIEEQSQHEQQIEETNISKPKPVHESVQAPVSQPVQRVQQTQSKPVFIPKSAPNPAEQYAILANKKAMHAMSSADMLILGDKIESETRISTRIIKAKFYGFVIYRIDNVLSGRMSPDDGFGRLIEIYGSANQRTTYKNMLSRAKSQATIVTDEPEQTESKKKSGGFFSKLGKKIKSGFDKVKKPVAIIGLAALSLFGGKKVYDSLDDKPVSEPVYENIVNTTPQSSNARKADAVKPLDLSVQSQAQKQNAPVQQQVAQPRSQNTETVVTNNAIRSTVKGLQHLKENNPIDRNMNVDETAQRLYSQFGNDAPRVVFVCKMAPYALNQYTNFDFRPSTHNMIEYLANHNLSQAQRAKLDTFVKQYMAQQSLKVHVQKQR